MARASKQRKTERANAAAGIKAGKAEAKKQRRALKNKEQGNGKA